MVKRITWLDLEGRFRITTPAYRDKANSHLTPDEWIASVWTKHIAYYGLPDDHPYHLIEADKLLACMKDCCESWFRYAGIHDSDGRCDGKGGAWEMGADGLPEINLAKARVVQMDKIRAVRNEELLKLDLPSLIAIERGDTDTQSEIKAKKQILRDIPATFDITTDADTPEKLKAKWPTELPKGE